MTALSNKQKRILSQLAERAFNLRAAEARGRGDAFDSSKAAADEWRHEQVATAVQKAGLRCCDQGDYKAVQAHFLNLLTPNQAGKAFNAQLKSHTEKRRQLEWLIVEACKRYGYALGFAAYMCLRIHKVNMDDASDEVLRLVLVTVNARGREKLNKAKQQLEAA